MHVNEPGRTEWEGFASATRAAAAGGVTTIVDMPLNSLPPTVDVAALEVKRKAAAGQCFVDVGFWGGAVPGNLADLRPLHDAGVFGFKCFLLDSGVDGVPARWSPTELEAALREVAAFDGLMIVHAEDARRDRATPPRRPAAATPSFLALPAARRRRTWPSPQVDRGGPVDRRAGLHILHLSSADALPMIRCGPARRACASTVETCPHYLTFDGRGDPRRRDAVQVLPADPRGAPTATCCGQALRRRRRSTASSPTTRPAPPDLKRLDTGDFGAAWGGISSLQLGLPAVWTEARRRGHTL